MMARPAVSKGRDGMEGRVGRRIENRLDAAIRGLLPSPFEGSFVRAAFQMR
jgi:hypothetical protein